MRSTATTASTPRTSTAGSTRSASGRPRAYEAARASVARFINAPDAHEVIFTRNATEAINLVAYSWGRQNIGRGDAIVLTEMEHHANLVPWQLLAQERDGDLEFIPITDDGDPPPGRLRGPAPPEAEARRVHPRLEHARARSTRSREMVDDGPRGRRAGAHRRRPGRAARAGRRPGARRRLLRVLRAQDARPDRAPGALWARRELLEAMPPFMAGGDMIREVHLRRSEWNDIPWKFEAGTPDIAAGHRARRGRGLPRRARHGPRPRARARAPRLRARRAPARAPGPRRCTARWTPASAAA